MLFRRKALLDVLKDDTRLLLLEEQWTEGQTVYFHVAPRAPVRVGHIKDRLRWLDSLMESLALVLKHHGHSPTVAPYRYDNNMIRFGQVLVDNTVVCVYPAIEVARRIVKSPARQLLLSEEEFGRFPM